MSEELRIAYAEALTREQALSDAFASQTAVVRSWPAVHPFQEMDPQVLVAQRGVAVDLGYARDASAAAWRALKKALLAEQRAEAAAERELA
jgi:hypothetical protein